MNFEREHRAEEDDDDNNPEHRLNSRHQTVFMVAALRFGMGRGTVTQAINDGVDFAKAVEARWPGINNFMNRRD